MSFFTRNSQALAGIAEHTDSGLDSHLLFPGISQRLQSPVRSGGDEFSELLVLVVFDMRWAPRDGFGCQRLLGLPEALVAFDTRQTDIEALSSGQVGGSLFKGGDDALRRSGE